ncbi:MULTISPECIES: cobalt-precorrin-6A reductase [unclassified Leptolyngbya]|uniref:cobalt-precorrin-6A reductase n=1 Tax=unclassified Leptolyngbya TaxID=2650499 RepID=UPI001687B144|nr:MULTISPECIES: cobalt-precorrin-6A reductase [unclassified Leptolyngbya]MBD1912119.1 cobalt-precorrin-6A reductase [Leptolyngbya sp. FACHB-8]MBD2155010.1 cobalt-precorrin-6A reductase [Leptolyngbya sp. FACHB-16]
MNRVLILGGTESAFQLAEALTGLGLTVMTSLAGRTQQPRTPVGLWRVGGFGGVAGLVAYLQQEEIDVVVDATHPFAEQMSQQAAIATHTCHIPRLMLVRPAWKAEEGDRWLSVPTLSAAAEILPGLAQRIFLAIGRQDLATFAPLRSLWFLMRLLEAPQPDAALPGGEILYGRPPFTVEQERTWMLEYRIEALVCKNSGGSTNAKLQAARELSLPVVMVERPPLPEGPQVATVAEAVEWVLLTNPNCPAHL